MLPAKPSICLNTLKLWIHPDNVLFLQMICMYVENQMFNCSEIGITI